MCFAVAADCVQWACTENSTGTAALVVTVYSRMCLNLRTVKSLEIASSTGVRPALQQQQQRGSGIDSGSHSSNPTYTNYKTALPSCAKTALKTMSAAHM
jgi:hypothetical protein